MTNSDLSPIYSDGDAYEMYMGQWSRTSCRDFVDWLGCADGGRWLDVGCGTGALCEVILNRSAPKEYVGVDVAEAQLDFSRSKYSDARARFQVDDALALSCDENEFDAAVSAYVINFFPEPRKMVAEMKRVVRPSGAVAAWTWDFAGNKPVSQHIITAISARRETDFKRADAVQRAESTRPEAMKQIFLDAGLENVRTTSVDTTVTYTDFDDYWVSNTAFRSTVSNYINELADEDRERFKAEVKALLPIAGDSTIRYTVSSIGAAGTTPAI